MARLWVFMLIFGALSSMWAATLDELDIPKKSTPQKLTELTHPSHDEVPAKTGGKAPATITDKNERGLLDSEIARYELLLASLSSPAEKNAVTHEMVQTELTMYRDKLIKIRDDFSAGRITDIPSAIYTLYNPFL